MEVVDGNRARARVVDGNNGARVGSFDSNNRVRVES